LKTAIAAATLCTNISSGNCTNSFIIGCQQTNYFSNLNQLICPSITPIQCDITQAPIFFGQDWMLECGKWVINNIWLPGERLNNSRLTDLCNLVNQSNANYLASNSSLRFLQTVVASGNIQTMSNTSDPTVNDTASQISDTEFTQNQGNTTIGGSTIAGPAGYNNTTYSIISANADLVINYNSSNTTTNLTGSSKILYLSSIIIFIVLSVLMS